MRKDGAPSVVVVTGKYVPKAGPPAHSRAGRIRSSEHASQFRNAGVRVNQPILPARKPVGFAYRAKQRKNFRWGCRIGLGEFVDDTISFESGHDLLQKKTPRARDEARG
jgi:hypothetical protein